MRAATRQGKVEEELAALRLAAAPLHSETWQDHLERLRRVLLELRRAGLTANPRKCHLALAEAQYLGFRVGRGLIQPQQQKVKAILTAPHPETKSQVRAFLGLAGYYRCFIPNFSTLASPLTDLTRKGQPEKVKWDETLDKTFRDIKTALTSEPVLRAPDFNCPFLLQTDASDTGLGAVLSEVCDGEEHPVTYISRKLTPAETRYAAMEKEALAIKWAVLELCYYLLGRRFTLMTDHAPLQWMAHAKDTHARVTRWFLALQDFHFTVENRAGTANSNADGLSRLWAAYAEGEKINSRLRPPPIRAYIDNMSSFTTTKACTRWLLENWTQMKIKATKSRSILVIQERLSNHNFFIGEELTPKVVEKPVKRLLECWYYVTLKDTEHVNQIKQDTCSGIGRRWAPAAAVQQVKSALKH
ncbi:hypothetical protein QQF64_034696 [Cirrhinus molitorella]|uniref:Reverse transcriptase RNase H-like domain-containing protein n=1 Tax=Cirrhinus molitorella TaxID=172907 RepID=A0ABR3L4I8_9TELE